MTIFNVIWKSAIKYLLNLLFDWSVYCDLVIYHNIIVIISRYLALLMSLWRSFLESCSPIISKNLDKVTNKKVCTYKYEKFQLFLQLWTDSTYQRHNKSTFYIDLSCTRHFIMLRDFFLFILFHIPLAFNIQRTISTFDCFASPYRYHISLWRAYQRKWCIINSFVFFSSQLDKWFVYTEHLWIFGWFQ